jgi:hypothetical protein
MKKLRTFFFMKKLIGLIFIVVFANSPIFSQVIKLENGVQ